RPHRRRRGGPAARPAPRLARPLRTPRPRPRARRRRPRRGVPAQGPDHDAGPVGLDLAARTARAAAAPARVRLLLPQVPEMDPAALPRGRLRPLRPARAALAVASGVRAARLL